MRKSTDGQPFVANDTGLWGLAQQVFGLAFGPGSGLVAATQAGVFFAADGAVFSELGGFPGPAPVAWSVAVAPGTPAVAIATTQAGVFRRLLP